MISSPSCKPDDKVKAGMMFFSLEVLNHLEGRFRRWVCKCICGEVIHVSQTELIRGKIRSCGCQKRNELKIIKPTNRTSHRRKDLTNQKFNLLTAIEFVGLNPVGNSVWLFRCECGKEINRTALQVVRGSIKSCGCKSREMSRTGNMLPEHGHIKNKAYRSHLIAAKKRGYRSDLTKEQYIGIAQKPCYYCGDMSVRTSKVDKMDLNSVDRLDNEPFYTLENSVSACFLCQNMKTHYSKSAFIRQAHKIARLHPEASNGRY